MSTIVNFFPQLVVTMVVAIITSIIAIPLCKPLGLIDNPGTAPHKLHSHPTPLAGGLVIAITILILIICFPTLIKGELAGMAISAAIILGFGLWDDISGLGAAPKFFGQFLAAGVAVFSGISIEMIPATLFQGNQVMASIVNTSFTLFWLVGVTNAFNLIDSMDGIVAGLSGIASAFFMFVSYTSRQPTLTLWAVVLTGISIALYFWNSPPAKYFLGDSGAQTLGFLLACLAILYTPENRAQASSWFVPILILGVPIFDTSMVVFSRIRRHSPPFEGNRDHTYHRMIHAGLNPVKSVSLLHLAALGLDSIAIFALYQPPLMANSIFALCLLIGAGLISVFEFSTLFINQPANKLRGE